MIAYLELDAHGERDANEMQKRNEDYKEVPAEAQSAFQADLLRTTSLFSEEQSAILRVLLRRRFRVPAPEVCLL